MALRDGERVAWKRDGHWFVAVKKGKRFVKAGPFTTKREGLQQDVA